MPQPARTGHQGSPPLLRYVQAGTRTVAVAAGVAPRESAWAHALRSPAGSGRIPSSVSAWRWVSLSFRLCSFRPESSCRGGASAGSRMIVESPTGMPSEDSTKAGLPILWVPAADRYAINARFVAAGSGAVLRCERRLPGLTTFASPKYPRPNIKLTHYPRHLGQFAYCARPDHNDDPAMLFSGGARQQRCRIDAVVTASMRHRCGCPKMVRRNDGPSMRFIWSELRADS